MLEIKAPWDQRVIEKIKFQKPCQIEEILESAKTNSLKKGSDFNIIQRIDVLENFCKLISTKSSELAKLASLEGGKPIKDSMIEIQRVLKIVI